MLKVTAILAGCLLVAGAATYGLVTQTEMFGTAACGEGGESSCPLSAAAHKLSGCCSAKVSPESPVSATVAPMDGVSAVGGSVVFASPSKPVSFSCCEDACPAATTVKATGLDAAAGFAAVVAK